MAADEQRMKARSIRCDDALWDAILDGTRAHDTSISEITREFWQWWLRLPGANMPRRP